MCRNTSHSNVLGYQARSTDNGDDDIKSRENHCFSRRAFYKESQGSCIKPLPNPNDHIIRISVNQSNAYHIDVDNDNDNDNDHSTRSIEESESAASVTIVEVDDRSSEEENTPNFIRNSLYNGPINTDRYLAAQNYTEKAVDVPEEFEKKAYASQLSPFVRNLQPNSQVCLSVCRCQSSSWHDSSFVFNSKKLFSHFNRFIFLFNFLAFSDTEKSHLPKNRPMS